MDSRRYVCLALLFAAVAIAGCSPQATPKPTATPTTLPPTAAPMPTATTEVPAPTLSGQVTVGFTEDGAPFRGNPDAPVTVIEYSEFL
jgi:protein-disulfide isomerase